MRKIASLLLLLITCTFVFAQQKSVTGTVTGEDGKPLAGATVSAKGANVSTATDASGKFSLNLTANVKTLSISYVGLATQEIAVKSGNISVQLKSQASEVGEVVITALGIKREKKALGYAVSTVNKKDLELRPEGDIARVLNGKAPGLNVLNSSGLSGSGTNIIVRAIGTITGNAQPLFIVDGVPFNGSTNTASNFTYGNQASSRFLDLDPNNIESVNVLKGLSATTLYGEFGRNGVIVITTKNGNVSKAPKKTEITVAQSFFINEVANLPEYNTKYGGGFDLSNGVTFFSNWGGPFSDPPQVVKHPYDRAALNTAFPEFIGAPYYYKQYKNNVKDFFRKGSVSNTSVSINGGNGNSGFNANFGYLKDIGFTVGNEMQKKTFGFGGTTRLTNNVTVTGSFNYVVNEVKSPPTSTSFGSSASNTSVFGDVMYTPTSVDLMGLPYQNPLDGSQVYYRQNNGIQNPRWTLYNSFTQNNVARTFGNMSVKYDINPKLNLSYRIGFDNYSEDQLYAQNKGGAYTPDGIMRSSNTKNTIWDQNVMLGYKDMLTEDVSLDLFSGLNIRNDIFKQNGILSTRQLVFGLLNHSNFIDHQAISEDGSPLDFRSELQTAGLYLQSQFGYRDYLFLNVGFRNSWSSVLEKNNRSIFYPSVTLSFIPTSVIPQLQNNNTINYLKIRTGYSTSAEFPDLYSTRPNLVIATKVFVDGGANAINTNAVSNRLPNSNLKPSLVKEFEFGVESKLVDNRVSVDFTYYSRKNSDQILDRDLDPSSGFTIQSINAGTVVNKGVEIALGYTVIRNKNWRLQLDGLYSRNRSMVSDIPADLAEIRTSGYSNLGTFAINGQPLGVIKGTAFQRADNGARLVGPSGSYLIDNKTSIIGNPNPDYKLTGITTLSYKALSLRVQIDYTHGGDMYSATSSVLLGRGVTRDTEFDRYLPVILPGVVDQEGKVANNIQISSTDAYFNNSIAGSAADEPAMFDATVVRIRELSLSYNMPQGLLKKSPFGSASFTLSANNLWYYAPNFPKYVRFDPETSSLGVSNGRGLELFTGPSARRYGASLRFTF